jgi:hypothetical protein
VIVDSGCVDGVKKGCDGGGFGVGVGLETEVGDGGPEGEGSRQEFLDLRRPSSKGET